MTQIDCNSASMDAINTGRTVFRVHSTNDSSQTASLSPQISGPVWVNQKLIWNMKLIVDTGLPATCARSLRYMRSEGLFYENLLHFRLLYPITRFMSIKTCCDRIATTCCAFSLLRFGKVLMKFCDFARFGCCSSLEITEWIIMATFCNSSCRRH